MVSVNIWPPIDWSTSMSTTKLVVLGIPSLGYVLNLIWLLLHMCQLLTAMDVAGKKSFNCITHNACLSPHINRQTIHGCKCTSHVRSLCFNFHCPRWFQEFPLLEKLSQMSATVMGPFEFHLFAEVSPSPSCFLGCRWSIWTFQSIDRSICRTFERTSEISFLIIYIQDLALAMTIIRGNSWLDGYSEIFRWTHTYTRLHTHCTWFWGCSSRQDHISFSLLGLWSHRFVSHSHLMTRYERRG